MNFNITQESGYVLIRSKVEKLDATTAPDLKNELIALNKSGINQVILDLTDSRYCDSSGLSAILAANRLCKDSNGQFILCGLQSNVSKLIAIAQLDKVLAISDDASNALTMLNN
jgi:anti-sigma B factor antagonist